MAVKPPKASLSHTLLLIYGVLNDLCITSVNSLIKFAGSAEGINSEEDISLTSFTLSLSDYNFPFALGFFHLLIQQRV